MTPCSSGRCSTRSELSSQLEVRTGFEPVFSGLQPEALSIGRPHFMEESVGLEPTSLLRDLPAFQAGGIAAIRTLPWLTHEGLNLEPLDSESSALPIELWVNSSTYALVTEPRPFTHQLHCLVLHTKVTSSNTNSYGRPAWIRTTITRFKVWCPSIERQGEPHFWRRPRDSNPEADRSRHACIRNRCLPIRLGLQWRRERDLNPHAGISRRLISNQVPYH